LRAVGVQAAEIPMHGLRSSRTIFELRRVVREHRVEVIHTHLTRATYLGYFAGFLTRVPVISTMHVLTRDFAYRWLPNYNHWYVTVSDYLRQALIARGVPEHRVETVYNGTDFAPYAVRPATHESVLSVRAELGLPADAELVGQIGRVDSFKGAPLLVRAAKEIVRHCPRAYFVFVGHAAPQIQQALWESACADGVDDRLRFTGLRDDVPRLMEAMDVITLPSQIESFGMVLIEAMAMARPVVATRAGGIPEVIQDQATGLLVNRTPEALAEAVIALLQDPARRIAMGQAGLARARSLFSAQSMAQNMERFYDRVLGQGRRES
jgi:glycosyltransferase involved in cell wall biosynthesis